MMINFDYRLIFVRKNLCVHFKIITGYRTNKLKKSMKIKCKCCGKELVDMPPDAKYCSIECTYGIPDFERKVKENLL